MSKLTWPAWFNGPKNETAIFDTPESVPAGWTSGAEKISVDDSKPKAAPKVSVPAPANERAATNAPDAAGTSVIDAHGHAWSADLHAASQSFTKAGLWRMKVGATRPDPKPGYPVEFNL